LGSNFLKKSPAGNVFVRVLKRLAIIPAPGLRLFGQCPRIEMLGQGARGNNKNFETYPRVLDRSHEIEPKVPWNTSRAGLPQDAPQSRYRDHHPSSKRRIRTPRPHPRTPLSRTGRLADISCLAIRSLNRTTFLPKTFNDLLVKQIAGKAVAMPRNTVPCQPIGSVEAVGWRGPGV